jgi:uncharacterized protein YggE
MNATGRNNLKFSLLLVLAASSLWAPLAFAQPLEALRTITVSGAGEASIAPDMARLNMSVIERADTTAAVQQQTAGVTNAVLKLLDQLGIDRKQINTTGASVRPDYRWNRTTEQQELRGYIGERRIEVELRDLDKLAQLIEGAIKAGVNNVSPPALDTTVRRETHRQALAAAVDDARANAAALADSLGVQLGAVVTVNAAGTTPPPMPMMRAAVMADSAESASQSYNAGNIKFNANVTVSFEIR